MIKNLVYTEEMKNILAISKSSSRKYETLGRKYTAFFSLEDSLRTKYFTELSTNGREFLEHYDV